jgi:pentatricopeptide repeat protein
MSTIEEEAAPLRQHGEQLELNFRRVAAELSADLGENHPRTLAAVHNIAEALCRQGLVKEAESLFDKVMCVQQKL